MSFIYSWIDSLIDKLLSTLGLRNKKGTILLLGLDNAGKTTLLHRLRTNAVVEFPPTERPNRESFQISGVRFVGIDMGGHEAVRNVWEDYIPEGNAIVFLIDASDPSRFAEAAEELDALISDGAAEQQPVAVLLNKCDLEWAVSTQGVAQHVGFEELAMRHGDDNIAMFRISVLKGEGYQEAFQWIASFL